MQYGKTLSFKDSSGDRRDPLALPDLRQAHRPLTNPPVEANRLLPLKVTLPAQNVSLSKLF